MGVERESAVINNQITLRNNFRYSQTNELFDPYAISKVEILDTDGSTVIQTITGASIVKDSTGKYHVVASAITTAKTIYDKWYFTPVSGAVEITRTNTCVVWTISGVSGNDLTSLANLRAFLKKQTADTSDDALLSSIITRVSTEIEQRCNRHFIAESVTEYHKGNGRPELLVRRPPINSVASIHIDSERLWSSDTALDADEIMISDDCPGLIILDGTIFDREQDIENVRVIYNGGYTTIPADLERNCLRLCAWDYLESSRWNNTVVKGEKSIDELRNAVWKDILNHYRIRTF